MSYIEFIFLHNGNGELLANVFTVSSYVLWNVLYVDGELYLFLKIEFYFCTGCKLMLEIDERSVVDIFCWAFKGQLV